MSFFNLLLDLIAPKKCYSCKKEGHFLCEDCMKKEKDFTSCCYVCKKTTQNFEVCQECKTMNSELKIEKQITLNNDKLNISHNINLPSDVYYDKIIILTNYSKLISKLIKDAKFYNKKEIFEDFTIYLYDKFLANQKVESLNDYLIISIPTYFLRKWKRGYNSSEVLCKYFAKLSKINYKKKIITKTKNVKQQSKLNKQERLVNLKGVFQINEKEIDKFKNKNIIIIDDVVSTGTTINEVAKVLKKYGAKEIIGLVIASGQ